MMEKREFHIGPGAASLLLVAVIVCMSVLGLLALSDVRNDARLTARSTALIEAQYRAAAAAEKDLAELHAALQDGSFRDTPEAWLEEHTAGKMRLENDLIVWDVEEDSLCRLHCAVRVPEDDSQPVWVEHRFVSLLEETADFDQNLPIF